MKRSKGYGFFIHLFKNQSFFLQSAHSFLRSGDHISRITYPSYFSAKKRKYYSVRFRKYFTPYIFFLRKLPFWQVSSSILDFLHPVSHNFCDIVKNWAISFTTILLWLKSRQLCLGIFCKNQTYEETAQILHSF